MKGLLVQVESTTDSIGELAQSGAFNYAEMAKELEDKGKENYRNTTFYKTVPVVAAWAAVRKAIEGTPISFRIVREQPRNPDNAPKSSLDRRILMPSARMGKARSSLRTASLASSPMPAQLSCQKAACPATAILPTVARVTGATCSDFIWRDGRKAIAGVLMF